MVAAVGAGESQRSVARRFRVPLSTVQHWLRRAAQQPEAASAFEERPKGRAIPQNRTDAALERQVIGMRQTLRQSALGFVGAEAIAQQLHARGEVGLPSVRTIGRILQRHGALAGEPRRRQKPPPPGWYLPRVASARAELESFDVVEDLRLEGGPLLSVFTGRALWRGDAAAWPLTHCVSETVVKCLVAHWAQWGLPDYAQFDNDTRFQGSHRYPDLLGRVVRLCLQLGVTPVFAPPREHGFQNLIESFNGLWQNKVWARFHHADAAALEQSNARFLQAWRARQQKQERMAPRRRTVPQDWCFCESVAPRGELVYLRRCDPQGVVHLLGHSFAVEAAWAHRLVRAEVDLDQHEVRFYRLRRKEPEMQELICRLPHQLPARSYPRERRPPRSATGNPRTRRKEA